MEENGNESKVKIMFFSLLLLFLVLALPAKFHMICEQRAQSQLLKFIASLFVVVGHEMSFYGIGNDLLMRETAVGALCVSFFLFMSGYGLLYGFIIKNQKLDEAWLRKRMVKLVVPALTAMALYVIAELYTGKPIDWQTLMTYWFVSDINLKYGWYVTEIVILYFAFFVCFRCFKPYYATWVLISSILLGIVVMVVCKVAVWYIQGLPCFVIGMIFAVFDMKAETARLKKYDYKLKLSIIIAVVVFCLFKNFDFVQLVFPVLDKWRYMYASFYVTNILFIIIIAYILMCLPVIKLMVNRGRYFYEVYLVQGATLLVCREWIKNDWLFVMLGLMCTIIVAKGMSMITNWIVKRI